jgi:hypothetical protein
MRVTALRAEVPNLVLKFSPQDDYEIEVLESVRALSLLHSNAVKRKKPWRRDLSEMDGLRSYWLSLGSTFIY